MMGQKMTKPCSDCADGRCTMNCGPSLTPSQTLRQHDLTEDRKRRATTAERKRSDRERQLRLLHDYVRIARALADFADYYLQSGGGDSWLMLGVPPLVAALHYGRLAQQIGETTYPACRAEWKKYLEEAR